MSGDVVSLAERRYQNLIDKRCTLTLPDGTTIRGRVLKGLTGSPGAPRRFRLRSRTVSYVLLSYAARLRTEAGS